MIYVWFIYGEDCQAGADAAIIPHACDSKAKKTYICMDAQGVKTMYKSSLFFHFTLAKTNKSRSRNLADILWAKGYDILQAVKLMKHV